MPHPFIVTDGAPVLRAVAKPVPKEMFGTPELRRILDRMSEALRGEPHGVAIAAPQIGESLRIFVVRGYIIKDEEKNDTTPDVAFINPVFVRQSKKKEVLNEGCLSVPGIYGEIERSVRATVRAQDEKGKKFERGGSGLLAEIFEHEIDHLEGKLFIDRATNLHKTRDTDEKK